MMLRKQHHQQSLCDHFFQDKFQKKIFEFREKATAKTKKCSMCRMCRYVYYFIWSSRKDIKNLQFWFIKRQHVGRSKTREWAESQEPNRGEIGNWKDFFLMADYFHPLFASFQRRFSSDGFIRTNKIAKKPISYLLSYEISFVTEETFLQLFPSLNPFGDKQRRRDETTT